MPKPALWTAAVFALVVLLDAALTPQTLLGEYVNGVGGGRFLQGARADTLTETIDCVLPGQIRPLGSTAYLTRGETVKTTKNECEARGGSLVVRKEAEAQISNGDPAGQRTHDSLDTETRND